MRKSDDSQSGRYERQDRGSREDYEAYFAGMDASMQQKVALTTAHFPARGRVADMGSGSGRGTFDLASLYRGLELVGVDINPVSVEMAARQYRRPNLSYVVGDISGMVFPENSLDGILDSSVLHHVTSFNDFDLGRVLSTLDHQVAQLKTGGVIIIRDFVVPGGPERAFLDLPATDGESDGDVGALSTAALFERFARDWRSSLNRHGPVRFVKHSSPREGFARYELSLRVATEFVLRKDYRDHWDAELLEEYTYLDQTQFEAEFRRRGLRVVTSMPIWNPWIVQNRYEGRFHLSALDGAPLPFPPTNYLIVGEKVRPGDGVELSEERARELQAPRFLGLSAHRRRDTGEVFELVERPNLTLDVVPWFEADGQIFVFAKKDFPRPLVNACAGQPRLTGSSYSGYITEPVSAIVGGDADEDAIAGVLTERAGFAREDVLRLGEPHTFYTSPGGINERVVSRLVEVRPRQAGAVPFPNYTPFKDAGTVREMDAAQVLRACHVGGMFDARLEVSVYRLLRSLGRKPGAWIGAPVELTTQRDAPFELTMRDAATTEPAAQTVAPSDASDSDTPDASALAPAARAVFEPCAPDAGRRFLSLREGSFAERDGGGRVLAEVPFEYVVPRRLSLNTVSALPALQTARGVLVGVEQRDLPAVQTFTGSSRIVTAPAWRLPLTLTHRSALPPFLAEAFARDFGLRVRRSWELGGPYFPTPGVTPEVVHPFACEVEPGGDATRAGLKLISVDELVARLDSIQDAHLLILACRLAHALGRM